MNPKPDLKRFLRSLSHPDPLSERQRERIVARRIGLSGSSERHDNELLPEQLEARDRSLLNALQKRQGRG
jgi:hypothetical protein